MPVLMPVMMMRCSNRHQPGHHHDRAEQNGFTSRAVISCFDAECLGMFRSEGRCMRRCICIQIYQASWSRYTKTSSHQLAVLTCTLTMIHVMPLLLSTYSYVHTCDVTVFISRMLVVLPCIKQVTARLLGDHQHAQPGWLGLRRRFWNDGCRHVGAPRGVAPRGSLHEGRSTTGSQIFFILTCAQC